VDLEPACLQANRYLATFKATHGNPRVKLKEVMLLYQQAGQSRGAVGSVSTNLQVELRCADVCIRFDPLKRQPTPGKAVSGGCLTYSHHTGYRRCHSGLTMRVPLASSTLSKGSHTVQHRSPSWCQGTNFPELGGLLVICEENKTSLWRLTPYISSERIAESAKQS